MSRSLARLNSSSRCIQPVPPGSALAPPRTPPVLRRYLHASARSRPALMPGNGSLKQTPLHMTRQNHTALQQEDGRILEADTALDTSLLTKPSEISESSTDNAGMSERMVSAHSVSAINEKPESDSRFSRHLNGQFPPLDFPPDLARRILTHGSHAKARTDGHNARLSFIGRRVLHTYLTLFLHSSPASNPEHNYELIAARTLNTYALGQHVAPKWNLGRVLRWHPTIHPEIQKSSNFQYDVQSRGSTADEELTVALRAHPQLMRSVGLYKVMGEAVQAVVGGVYHQFGASVAHRIFHTRILPYLLLRGPLGLHEAYHADAFDKGKSMGSNADGGARPQTRP